MVNYNNSQMAERDSDDGASQVGAKPIHMRLMEQSLNLTPFLRHTQQELAALNVNNERLNDTTDDSEDEQIKFDGNNCIDPNKCYNFTNVGEDRLWLKDILITPQDCSVDEPDFLSEEYLRRMLKQHVQEKKLRQKYHKNVNKNSQYLYYGSSLLSKQDMYAENLRNASTKKKDGRDNKKAIPKKLSRKNSFKNNESVGDMDDSFYDNYPYDSDDNMKMLGDSGHTPAAASGKGNASFASTSGNSTRSNRRTAAFNSIEAITQRRRKLWILMCKKEMGKVQRAKATNHKEQLQACKRAAQLCMKLCRQKAMQSQKNMKETVWRSKRLTREMQSYWKRYDRVEREMRRRMEKEAEEQRKMDVEMIEAKRQQRKLNFLITQTELYAHFMSKKLAKASPEEQLRILSQLDEKKVPRLAPLDDYDSEIMKAKAKKNVIEAIESDRARTKQFDHNIVSASEDLSNEENLLENVGSPSNTVVSSEEEHPQPSLFKGHLKGYQLKGMNWLANLYDQGISGILADEMGLGKTVQSIAFLCHVAEKYSVWGPFLVISPASTLHNWQQEMARFVPDFRVVPYWGNPNERKILRQFWEQKDLHTKGASFHVVITSYQIIITDFKYFNRIKWQYMILDEAQAIKSSSSVRWKMLLGFSCRNRLLLSGTPIQNSMAELWALLHFIMPTLFDSHDEFNEWFSKDIESHVENKTGIDEKHLSRLHMILKPFMLRRIKKDVENELSDKIEVMLYCPLTRRQNLLYMALKKKIHIEDLLHYTVNGGDTNSIDKNFTSNLMNLVMQFRKVCNHPELFERRDAKSPALIEISELIVPKLLYNYEVGAELQYVLYNLFYLWTTEGIHRSQFDGLSFIRFLRLSPADLHRIFAFGCPYLFINYRNFVAHHTLNVHMRNEWWSDSVAIPNTLAQITLKSATSFPNVKTSKILRELIFTNVMEIESTVYTHKEHRYFKLSQVDSCSLRSICDSAIDEISYNTTRTIPNAPTNMPPFLFSYNPKVVSRSIRPYCSCARFNLSPKSCVHHHTYQGYRKFPTPFVSEDDSWNCLLCTNRMASLIIEARPQRGWFNVVVPDKETLVTDAGKLSVLDPLLKKLKNEGHRVLIYSQMTKMIDLLEEYMWHRKHKYMRLDGSSKISERRDMVADFQARTDIFVFLLSTRAGGLGINLTAADTVIFYDSDWNPTVDQQAMDRAHRLGQTKQVTVYRLICKGTIEERILQRAREKSEIQRMVISGGNFKPDTLKPKEVVSLLLDDEEIESKYRQKAEERKNLEEIREKKERDRKRKQLFLTNSYIIDDMNEGASMAKRIKEDPDNQSEEVKLNVDEGTVINSKGQDEGNDDVDIESPSSSTIQRVPLSYTPSRLRLNGSRGTGARRGRPRGSRRSALNSRSNGRDLNSSNSTTPNTGETIRNGFASSSTSSVSTLGDDANTSNETVVMIDESGQTKSVPIRRGPGRPRLKPNGPSHQGSRGSSRPRKPVRALPVPLRSQTLLASSLNTTNGTSQNGREPTSFRFYNSSSNT